MSLFASWIRALVRVFVRDVQPPIAPPEAVCPISWQPSVTAPVFYGVRHLEPFGFALFRFDPSALSLEPPGTFRVFFPSIDGSPDDARVLDGCGRYPLIAFLHGHCSNDRPLNHTKWYELPAQLARSGYVVVVPYLAATARGSEPFTNTQDIAVVLAILRWMRTQWPHAHVLLPNATGITGHSFGALLAARIALEQNELADRGEDAIRFSAYASLSGVWRPLGPPPWPLHRLQIPKLLTWGGDAEDPGTNLTMSQFWDPLPLPRHAAEFADAAHWDYLPPGRSACGATRGPCPRVLHACGDLVPAFFGKYLPPEHWPALRTTIPDNLIATLDQPNSPERQFFAGGHLMGMKLFDATPPPAECQLLISWDTADGSGEERHPNQ